jgi:hypothetical protein
MEVAASVNSVNRIEESVKLWSQHSLPLYAVSGMIQLLADNKVTL